MSLNILKGIKNKYEKIIWDKTEIGECWKEYFWDLYGNYSDMLKNRTEIKAKLCPKKN